MSRELKFRAWDDKNKKFAFVGFYIMGEVTAFDLLDQYSLEEGINLEITQWTSLVDKKEVDVYIGDVLKGTVSVSGNDISRGKHTFGTTKDVECLFTVEWSDENAACVLVADKKNTYKTFFYKGTGSTLAIRNANAYKEISVDIKCPIARVKEFEIIGNIYQNPELNG